MTTGTLNGIDVPALEALADSVETNPGRRAVAFRVRTEWKGRTRSVATVSGYRLGAEALSRHFEIHADEPPELLGENTAPNPQELLLAALNACMTVGYAASAAAKGIALEALEIETEGQLDLRGFLGLDPAVRPGYEAVRYTVRIRSSAPREKIEELHRWVMRTSPNVSNFATAIRMIPTLVIDTP